MEIKFWDNINNEYSNTGYYYLDEDMSVYRVDSTEYYGDYLEFMNNIEPHFYINGERVA